MPGTDPYRLQRRDPLAALANKAPLVTGVVWPLEGEPERPDAKRSPSRALMLGVRAVMTVTVALLFSAMVPQLKAAIARLLIPAADKDTEFDDLFLELGEFAQYYTYNGDDPLPFVLPARAIVFDLVADRSGWHQLDKEPLTVDPEAAPATALCLRSPDAPTIARPPPVA